MSGSRFFGIVLAVLGFAGLALMGWYISHDTNVFWVVLPGFYVVEEIIKKPFSKFEDRNVHFPSPNYGPFYAGLVVLIICAAIAAALYLSAPITVMWASLIALYVSEQMSH